MTPKERLLAVIDYLHMNPNSFSDSLGLKRSERIYRITRDNNKITPALAHLITSKYNNISYEWLLHEKGKMLVDDHAKVIRPQSVEKDFPHTLEACLRRLEDLEKDNEKLWDQIKWQNNRIDFLLAKLLEAKEIKPEKSNNK